MFHGLGIFGAAPLWYEAYGSVVCTESPSIIQDLSRSS
jgi:hypothetical protein